MTHWLSPSDPLASGFLWSVGIFFLLLYAAPLLLFPLRWARWFRWRLPQETELTVYFGRCLGAVAVAIVFFCLRAAPDPRANRSIFFLLCVAGVLLTAVHVYGALRRAQPASETAEIGLYVGVTAVSTWMYLITA
jgi:drug/metabolite transporter (DMT)-like permease